MIKSINDLKRFDEINVFQNNVVVKYTFLEYIEKVGHCIALSKNNQIVKINEKSIIFERKNIKFNDSNNFINLDFNFKNKSIKMELYNSDCGATIENIKATKELKKFFYNAYISVGRALSQNDKY